MSRSNTNSQSQNPSTCFFEWNGEKGLVNYYDKIQGKKIELNLPFTFIVLDQLAVVKGWNDSLQKGVYSNEVRNTLEETFSVKIFENVKPIAEGFYREIKDKVLANGGHFVSSIYIAFKNENGELVIGNLQLKGAGLDRKSVV